MSLFLEHENHSNFFTLKLQPNKTSSNSNLHKKSFNTEDEKTWVMVDNEFVCEFIFVGYQPLIQDSYISHSVDVSISNFLVITFNHRLENCQLKPVITSDINLQNKLNIYFLEDKVSHLSVHRSLIAPYTASDLNCYYT